MHEVSLMSNILQMAEDSLSAYRVKQVNELLIKVGKLSGVIIGSLEFAFEALSESSICRGAKLKVIFDPIVVVCEQCGNQLEVITPIGRCGICESGNISIIGGTDMYLQSIDFEEEDI